MKEQFDYAEYMRKNPLLAELTTPEDLANEPSQLSYLLHSYRGEPLPKDVERRFRTDGAAEYNEIAPQYKKFLADANAAMQAIEADPMFDLWKKRQEALSGQPVELPRF